MYKKILAPLDGSELSECTLDHVSAIGSGCQVPEVILLQVIEPLQTAAAIEIPETFANTLSKQRKKDAGDYLRKAVERIKRSGLKVETAIANGEPADEILKYAEKNKVDLIVMSTHGRSGIVRWAMGSVAEKIVRHSPVPVLTVTPPGCRKAG
jgi:nucleotide-binding universal stress UspA family protein